MDLVWTEMSQGESTVVPKSCPLHMETPENWALLEQQMKNSLSLTLLWFPLNFIGSQGQRPSTLTCWQLGWWRTCCPVSLEHCLWFYRWDYALQIRQHSKGQGSLLLRDFSAVHFPFVFSWHPLFSVLGLAHWANCDADMYMWNNSLGL